MIVRRKHNSRYATMPNAIWSDGRLSAEAKGVLGYLLSCPHDWNVRLDQVAKVMQVGKDKIQRIFRELVAAGYVSREQRRGAEGTFGFIEYVVRDEPEPDEDEEEEVLPITDERDFTDAPTDAKSVAFLPQPGLPATVEPQPVFQAAYKERIYTNNKHTKIPLQTSPPQRLLDRSSGLTKGLDRPDRPSPRQAPRIGGDRGQFEAQIAGRLGDRGWQILLDLPPAEVDQLCTAARLGRLTPERLAEVETRWLAERARIERKPGAAA